MNQHGQHDVRDTIAAQATIEPLTCLNPQCRRTGYTHYDDTAIDARCEYCGRWQLGYVGHPMTVGQLADALTTMIEQGHEDSPVYMEHVRDDIVRLVRYVDDLNETLLSDMEE